MDFPDASNENAHCRTEISAPAPETGERYTVKKYQSVKAVADAGTWRHIEIVLKPTNPAFQPIHLTCEDEGSVQVVAELLDVLG